MSPPPSDRIGVAHGAALLLLNAALVLEGSLLLQRLRLLERTLTAALTAPSLLGRHSLLNETLIAVERYGLWLHVVAAVVLVILARRTPLRLLAFAAIETVAILVVITGDLAYVVHNNGVLFLTHSGK